MTTLFLNDTTNIFVESHQGKVHMVMLTEAQDSSAQQVINIEHPEIALRLAEGIREAAEAAKVYQENNPNA